LGSDWVRGGGGGGACAWAAAAAAVFPRGADGFDLVPRGPACLRGFGSQGRYIWGEIPEIFHISHFYFTFCFRFLRSTTTPRVPTSALVGSARMTPSILLFFFIYIFFFFISEITDCPV
jgi:hypothetical protein